MVRGSRLRDTTIAHTVEAMRGFRAMAHGAGAGRCMAVATSAVRQAANGCELASEVREQTGIEIETIDSAREAMFAFRGAVHGLSIEHGMVLDVGGWSVQLVQFRDRQFTRS